ncbi:MAG: topoisomerase protein [Candidatus Amesbacteria bacterium GW2011_GWB1_47_19]|nr:MAG: topoisomerase protein [Candidatus Amesbacteria bacterium GW2011_GWA1_44_24]KKU31456.1 MAG: topoisomerase protein [Candidatus Amesbacteria bacterium GW2011_GWC1_46_24]KKU67464.1 MAG: topoisomerase protein [Candidatus Amesbacteria bacterium GW2011_GWB1_47_19]OGD05113.1 MAG: DNA topoisomerase I [Candidatus Amesbacteria bacterium RIFOXYB1_FULL_47_13]
MDLVIVESPTKARTLARFLGSGYEVEASYGHVRDLPERKMGIKIERESGRAGEYKFEPEFTSTKKQTERMEEIKKMGNKAEKIYLATDPDREGEAIAFHVSQMLGKHKFERVVFHEITENAIREAMGNPGVVNMRLVEAQQARRIVDRLVGYKLSPLLWRKVRRGLSAGRVQSVAVRLVVEREREIEAFKPEEYWVIRVELQSEQETNKQSFWVTLTEKGGEKYKAAISQEAEEATNYLRTAKYTVGSVEEKEFKRTPPAPFTTSTLQQTAANRLGWSAKRTMQIAQALYEQGHITYHRTDSTNLAMEALRSVANFLTKEFGPEYALKIPRMYKTKSKLSQEAHEAIRPTKVNGDSRFIIQDFGLSRDELRLYELIWKRFVACQMAEVSGVSMKVGVIAGEYGLEAKGETITFDGWLRLYQSTNTKEQNGEVDALGEEKVPELAEGERLDFLDLKSEQKFTLPPPRYTDASLIKALEEEGIGRPSTYAPTLTTIQDRQYVDKSDKKFQPTALGIAVNDFLVTNFPDIVDYEFTAKIEDDLDGIAEGNKHWQPVVSDFYGPFEKKLDEVGETAVRVQVQAEETGEACPKCSEGRQVIRIGRFGKFLACSLYPGCDWKANFVNKTGQICPKCGGDVVLKRTRSRKSFFGCSNYPNCDFASWTRPSYKAPEGEVKPETV